MDERKVVESPDDSDSFRGDRDPTAFIPNDLSAHDLFEHESDSGDSNVSFQDLECDQGGDDLEVPVSEHGDIKARAKYLQNLLHDHDTRKSLRSDGPWHYSSKGLLLICVFITKSGPFTHEQLTELIALLCDEDVKSTDLSMVTGRSLLELAGRKTPSIPLERVESTKTTITRRNAFDGINEGSKKKRKNPSTESRTVTKKSSLLIRIAAFVHTPAV